MRNNRSTLLSFLIMAVLLCCFATAFASEPGHGATLDFPPALESYGDAGLPILERLSQRIEVNPFNLAGTLEREEFDYYVLEGLLDESSSS